MDLGFREFSDEILLIESFFASGYMTALANEVWLRFSLSKEVGKRRRSLRASS